MPLQQAYAATLYYVAQLTSAMVVAQTPAMELCLEINHGRGPGNGGAMFNGGVIVISNPGQAKQLVCEPGSWIVMDGNGVMDVHADADFHASYVLK